eukprot:7236622-Prymnesium_polylepis.1
MVPDARANHVTEPEVSAALREVCAEILPGTSADTPLMEAGLDSLGVIEFRNRLSSRLERVEDIPDTLIFDFPTVRQLEAHLSAQVLQMPGPATAAESGNGEWRHVLTHLLGVPAVLPDELAVTRDSADQWNGAIHGLC